MIYLLLALLALLVGGLLPFAFLRLVRRQANLSILWGLLIAAGLLGLPVAFFITYNAADFFPGPGMCLSILSFPLAAFALLVLRWRGKTVREELADSPTHQRAYQASQWLIPGLLVLPVFVSMTMTSVCNRLNRGVSRQIVEAMEVYASEWDRYPNDVALLVPDHMDAIPEARCFAPFAWVSLYEREGETFEIHVCEADTTVLMTPLVGDGSFQQRYNLATGVWTGKVSFLDGSCSHLR